MQLLLPIGAASVLDPTAGMVPVRIVVRPMHDTALVVVFEFAGKRDRVAGHQSLNTRREVNVVCDQHRSTRREADDEALMT